MTYPPSRPGSELGDVVDSEQEEEEETIDLEGKLDKELADMEEVDGSCGQSFTPQVPEVDFTPPTPRDMDRQARSQLQDFSSLLNSIDGLDDKLKLLWKQIYENAVTDRKNAFMVWADLYMYVHGQPDQHTLHGDHIAKYMERMEKANSQLLKLAELVQKAKEEDEKTATPAATDIFKRLEKKFQ